MTVNDLLTLFKQAKGYYDSVAECSGQEGDTDTFELYDKQSVVTSNIINYLENSVNKEIHLPIVLRQLKNEFPDFNVSDFDGFILSKITTVDSQMYKLKNKLKN